MDRSGTSDATSRLLTACSGPLPPHAESPACAAAGRAKQDGDQNTEPVSIRLIRPVYPAHRYRELTPLRGVCRRVHPSFLVRRTYEGRRAAKHRTPRARSRRPREQAARSVPRRSPAAPEGPAPPVPPPPPRGARRPPRRPSIRTGSTGSWLPATRPPAPVRSSGSAAPWSSAGSTAVASTSPSTAYTPAASASARVAQTATAARCPASRARHAFHRRPPAGGRRDVVRGLARRLAGGSCRRRRRHRGRGRGRVSRPAANEVIFVL